jgi:hypothetical protein
MKHLQNITKKTPCSSSPQEASKLTWLDPISRTYYSIECQDGMLGLHITGSWVDVFKPFLPCLK